MSAAAPWLRAAAALLLLNTLLTFGNRLPGLGVQWQPRLSFELALVLAAWAAWAVRAGPLAPRTVGRLATLGVLLVVARYVDVTVPAVFGRPVNVYWDGRHALEVLRLALDAPGANTTGRLLLGAALAAAAFVAMRAVLRWAIGTLAHTLARADAAPLRRLAWVNAAVMTAFFVAYTPGGADTRYLMARPLAPMLAHQAGLLASALWPWHAESELGASPPFERHGLDGLHGADVVLLFAESYGAATLDRPEQAAAMREPRERLDAAIRAGGRGVVSARVRSPTFGGGSWLAHAALLAGIDTADPDHYELLLASRRPTLVDHFARHGWRTVGWMPGLQKAWPEGSFYGYDRLAGADAIGYAGPAFGFWRIPDQVAMAQLARQELAPPADPPRRAPRFVVFPTLGTHAPFRPLAPYVGDWSRVLAADAYTPAQQAAALAAPVAWNDAGAYLDALRYQFDWLSGFLRERAPHPLVMVIVGDHQPLAAVSGAGASWDVPVHVVADDPALLQRLTARGFEPGLLPRRPALGALHELTGLLVQAFDAP